MKILALEFSSPRRSVAVAVDGETRGLAHEPGGRTTHAFAMIDQALDQAGLGREQIECLVVGLGPGSYAGIRIGIAIAQGWQMARGVKLLGISSADAVAARAGQAGHTQVWVGLDAQRRELFAARYDVTEILRPRLITPFQACGPDDLAHVLRMDLQPATEEGEACSWIPEAGTLAALAAHRTDFVPGAALQPTYLRPAEFVKAPPSRFEAF
jgi:tRNA threonylcarbamoyl adenosine modification protein YeaZ